MEDEESQTLLLERRNQRCWYTKKAELYYLGFGTIILFLGVIASAGVICYSIIYGIINTIDPKNVTNFTLY